MRNAKAHYDIDLGKIAVENFAESEIMRVLTDVVAFSDTFYGLYNRHLENAGVLSQDDFDELLENSDIDAIRDQFVMAAQGFFPLLGTLYTAVREGLIGSLQPLTANQNEPSKPASGST